MPLSTMTDAVQKKAKQMLALGLLLVCMACTIAPPSPPVQTQTFAHLPQLNWRAAPPEIRYAPGINRPEGATSDPVSIVQNWVRDRLPFGGRFQGNGGPDGISVTFTLMAAGITENRSKVPGLLVDYEQVSLQGILKVQTQIRLHNGTLLENMIEARAVLNREGAISLNELDAGRFLVIQRLSTDFDRRMEAYLRRQNIVF